MEVKDWTPGTNDLEGLIRPTAQGFHDYYLELAEVVGWENLSREDRLCVERALGMEKTGLVKPGLLAMGVVGQTKNVLGARESRAILNR